MEQNTSENQKLNQVPSTEDNTNANIKFEPSFSDLEFNESEGITLEWIKQLITDFENQKYIHKKFIAPMLKTVQNLLEKEKSIVDITIPNDVTFTVCGDIHGQFFDLQNIFKINGVPGPLNFYLFNGDFVNRGKRSVECIFTLLAWKILYPDFIYLSRGNHECEKIGEMYGFKDEIIQKYGDVSIFESFSQFFRWLPLGYVLNKKILVVHGGLSSKENLTLEELSNIDRVKEPELTGVMTDLLWSDPCQENGINPSPRGVSCTFGPDIANAFLDSNGLDLLIRSHEFKDEGYGVLGRVITVFSAPNYCGSCGNKGAIAKFPKGQLQPEFIQFESVENAKTQP